MEKIIFFQVKKENLCILNLFVVDHLFAVPEGPMSGILVIPRMKSIMKKMSKGVKQFVSCVSFYNKQAKKKPLSLIITST